ncbi:hypothetical protein [Hymenobacter rubripertinctus]|uniref:Uncharacterized protein n=1 Tax=Hymenobacter rubripertinctus TaxID=2029981 RepID=A0A418QP38_9BACT|nr:hypothetical protein [Hymenobacter rubripertinctus]RIY06892.1 hypothetical protein D0T11_17850 [Hymenobacter rubripertinctus]
MFNPTTTLVLPLVTATTLLLSSCSDSSAPTTERGAEQAAKQAQQYPFGGKIDSLNGISGHMLGDPLTSFSQMEAGPANPQVMTRFYPAVPAQEKGWFAKHSREVPEQYYYFLDGKFSSFRALGDGPTLRAEVDYLLGPGLVEGSTTFWEGQHARAVYSERAVAFGRLGQLDIISKPLEAEMAAREQAKLKADNEQ